MWNVNTCNSSIIFKYIMADNSIIATDSNFFQ